MTTVTNHAPQRRTVGEWLSELYEWRIPVYQRHYAWNPKEEFGPTQLFWEIVEEQATKRLKGKNTEKNLAPHYFGAILVKSKTEPLQSTQKYDVVDGQQRLTTIHVAMFAIIRVATKLRYRAEVQDKLAKYIFNDSDTGSRSQPKLIPTNFDRTQFGNLLSFAYDAAQPEHQDDSENAKASKVVQACNFFSEEFKEFIERNGEDDKMATIDALIDTIIDGFELVLIPLKETDEAQKVFESLNNTARPLTTFDLIRNNIFYRADDAKPGSDVELFNSPQWQQFEDIFWEEQSGRRRDKTTHAEAYIARMLMAKKQQVLLLNRDSIFKDYKKFASEEEKAGRDVRTEIATISDYVPIYKHLVEEKNAVNPLGAEFRFGYFMHGICKSMDFYPAIFAIAKCDAPVEEKQRMVNLLESYVLRRHVCKMSSGDYNKQAPRICEALGRIPSYEKLDAFLKGSQGTETRAFPSEEQVRSGCRNNNFYARNHLKTFIFGRLVTGSTDANRDEKRDLKGLTIDHILPQGWRDGRGWVEALSEFQDEDVDIKIHTIGNLTPMSKGLNSGKSNRGWGGPKGARAHLRECDLKMTRKLADHDKWDIDAIEERSKDIADRICKIWPEDIQ